jgi:protein-tyrosine phosphatase/nicotinamidase-related amidase
LNGDYGAPDAPDFQRITQSPAFLGLGSSTQRGRSDVPWGSRGLPGQSMRTTLDQDRDQTRKQNHYEAGRVRSILITQCLQRDFIDLVAPHEPLPNKLHVGREEAQRLLGPDPSGGPVAQLLAWARAQKSDDIRVVHIRDWHDPGDPQQADHLAMFGPHCLRDTAGSKLVVGMDEKLRGNEILVDAIALNDFEHTGLAEALAPVLESAKHARVPVRVGVVGVWTEAKVSFLLYDLKTRLGIDALATCSALTASASRSQHFNALDQLKKILGVSVFDSVGDFTEWLLPDGAQAKLPTTRAVFGAGLDLGDAPVNAEDRDIVGFLYRDSSRIELNPLSGGFSGAGVYRVTSHDAMGHEQAASVVKLGPRALIGAERTAFERVESVLGNHAPSVKGFVDFGARAGIKYAFASMGGQVQTLKSLYSGGAPQHRIDAVLQGVFGDILGRLYAAAQYERMPLLEHYGFEPRFTAHVKQRVAAIIGESAATADRIEIRGHAAVNVVRFYEEFLRDRAIEPGEYHFVSFVHGDLNAANILVDGRENVWVIDYFHTSRGHVLKDLTKLENDLLYILTEVNNDTSALDEALAITHALRSVEDLAAPLPQTIAGVTSAPFLRAWATLRTLRGFVAQQCRSDRDPQQLRIALLRYAVHTLSFDESNPLQKQWALASACTLAEDVMDDVKRNRKLRIDWIDTQVLPWHEHGRFGMTILPGRKDRGRSLAEDLDTLKSQEVTRMASLVTSEELQWAGVPTLRAEAMERGIDVMQCPIRDQATPSVADAQALVRWILAGVDAKQNVVVHCMGGLGRSGTITACVMVARGASADEAIATVRAARGPRAIEIAEQERFVRDFAQSGRS